MPLEPLDGELWIGRRQFQRTVSIVRRQDATELWKEVRFVIFDAPAGDQPFEERLALVRLIMDQSRPPYAVALPHHRCEGRKHLERQLAEIEADGGEGLMLRQPGSHYVAGRSSTLLKVKRFLDAEARVIGHEPGSGRHKGRLGALLVEMADGTRFCVGTGFSDSQRDNPPPIGTIIRFRYQELSDRGVPRFPSYAGVCPEESPPPPPFAKGDNPMPKRRFEYVNGSSSKFWEIETNDSEVLVRFGRIGTNGQAESKTLASPEAAEKHADKKIAEKLAKGYSEV